jgi:hypothetical protein
MLCDVGDHARVEHERAVVRANNATIENERGAPQVLTNLLNHFLQGFQTLRQQDHVRLMDGGDGGDNL